jgi:hypothetical protein
MKMGFGKRHYFSVLMFTLAVIFGGALFLNGFWGKTGKLYLFVIDFFLFCVSIYYIADAVILDWRKSLKTATVAAIAYTPLTWAICYLEKLWR